MNKIFMVAQREYLEHVRTKGFWFGIISVPLIYSLFFFVPSLLERTRSAQEFVVLDESGWLMDAIERRVLEQDLTFALGEVRQRAQADSPDKPLPDAFAPMREALLQADDAAIPQLAAALAAPDADASALPLELQQALTQRDAVVAWWRGLGGEEARAFSPLMSKGQYSRKEANGATPETLNQRIIDGDLFAYFIIGANPIDGSEGFRYYSKNLTDNDLKRWFSAHATDTVAARRMAQESIDPQVAAWLQTPVRFEGLKVSESGEAKAADRTERLRQWAPTVLVYILWIAVFINVQMLLSNTIEEKSNRLIEVLLSSISPVQLMSGKILGIAMTGLTTLAVWALSIYLGALLLPQYVNMPSDLNLAEVASDPVLLISFVIYFAMGYLFYAAILAGLGSVCNSLRDAQNIMTPIMLVLFVPLLLMIPVGKDPNGMLAQVFSFIPPFTPFVMLNRAAGPPELWEYVATTLLMALSIAAAFWAAAKVFRIGILMTGKPPKIGEILRWIKAPVGQIPHAKNDAA